MRIAPLNYTHHTPGGASCATPHFAGARRTATPHTFQPCSSSLGRRIPRWGNRRRASWHLAVLVYLAAFSPWMANVKLGEALGAVFAGHISFSLAGVVRSAAAPPPARPVTDGAHVGESGRSEAVAEVVASMYSGGGVDASACTPDVTFTDPAASCCGKPEVIEAFRALAASCRPKPLSKQRPPRFG